jgi:hypothetical protein
VPYGLTWIRRGAITKVIARVDPLGVSQLTGCGCCVQFCFSQAATPDWIRAVTEAFGVDPADFSADFDGTGLGP